VTKTGYIDEVLRRADAELHAADAAPKGEAKFELWVSIVNALAEAGAPQARQFIRDGYRIPPPDERAFANVARFARRVAREQRWQSVHDCFVGRRFSMEMA
jgi:hypothetical protein